MMEESKSSRMEATKHYFSPNENRDKTHTRGKGEYLPLSIYLQVQSQAT